MNVHILIEVFLGGVIVGALAMGGVGAAMVNADKADRMSDLEDEVDRLRKLTGEPI